MTASVAQNDEATLPRALYVHLPWCIRKCPYCDFNSHEVNGRLPEREYLNSLTHDLHYAEAHGWDNSTFGSVFFGGGTPSLFAADSIAQILTSATLVDNVEVTIEANPGTVEAGRFAAYREADVNRLSIGVQTLRDEKLEVLGRIHNSKQARLAVDLALQAGFESVNIDLMYGLPGDSVAGSIADLECVIDTGVQHVSWYQLTIEPGTAFAHKPPTLPDEEIVEEIEREGRALLISRGFERYEISAYAKSVSHRTKHNLNYWQFGDYLGLGAGAHSKLTTVGGMRRESRIRSPQRYMTCAREDNAVETITKAAPGTIMLEFLMNALRLTDGFTFEMFESRTGLDRAGLRNAARYALGRGMLVATDTALQPTELGLRYLNDLLASFGQNGLRAAGR